MSHQPIQNSVVLFRGHRSHRQNTRSHFPNNFVKQIFVFIGHCKNVLARCDSIFPLLRCQAVWNKTCTQLSLSQILFQNPKNYSLGDVQSFDYPSWCDSTVILIKSATAAMFTLVRVDYQLSSVSKSRIPTKNVWSAQSLIPISLLHQN